MYGFSFDVRGHQASLGVGWAVSTISARSALAMTHEGQGGLTELHRAPTDKHVRGYYVTEVT